MIKSILIVLLLLSLTSCSTQVSEDSNVNDHINSNKALEIAKKKRRTLEQYGIRGFHSKEEKIQILEKAREAGTLNASGHNVLGFEYHNQGRFKDAIENYKEH